MRLNEELSYKQICSEFNEPLAKSGRGRQQQLNRWRKFYDIEKVGRGKYIINRALTIQEIQDIQDKNNYSQYLQNMLLNYFASNEFEHTYTYRELREHLAMVNNHYFPVKYGKEQITLNLSIPVDINEGPCENNFNYSIINEERKWFDIAEAHDKDVLKYAIDQLLKKNLICSCTKTYVLYRVVALDKDSTILEKKTATSEQVSKLDQIKLDFVKEMGLSSTKALYSLNHKQMEAYKKRVDKYIHSIGFNRYARAFTIVRPADLQSVVRYFAPKFNTMQVERYLNSKRFEKLEPCVHQQLTNKLIKKESIEE